MESIFDWLEPTEAGLFDVSDGADRLRDVLRIHRAGERPDLDGNGKADVLLWTHKRFMVLMEAP